jgi:tRNA dimethylallyltransferase
MPGSAPAPASASRALSTSEDARLRSAAISVAMNIVSPSRPRLALIAGPTASGKSARALALADAEGGTIVNADASQVYRDLRILSARPDAEEEGRVPHRLYGCRDGAAACSAVDWAADAKAAIATAVREGRLPILVGGTGLYLRVLLDGIAPVPEIDAEVRREVRALDAEAARAALAREDPAAAARLHANDTSRLQRALEVVRSTGRTLAAWQADRVGGIRADYDVTVEIVDPPIAALYANCDSRMEAMIAGGALDEVATLLDRNLPEDLPVMRAIGVPEFGAHLRGQAMLTEAIARAKQRTRNYAKRQRTWFRNQALSEE